MPRPSEDRIRDLCTEALQVQEEDRLVPILEELRDALHDRAQYLKDLAPKAARKAA